MIDAEGRLATAAAFSHAGRIRLSPIVGCAFKCDHCDLPGSTTACGTSFVHAGYPWTSAFEDGVVVTRLDVRRASPLRSATGIRPPAPTR